MLGNICRMAICLGLNPFNADICFKMQISAFQLNVSAFQIPMLFAHLYLYSNYSYLLLKRFVFLEIFIFLHVIVCCYYV